MSKSYGTLANYGNRFAGSLLVNGASQPEPLSYLSQITSSHKLPNPFSRRVYTGHSEKPEVELTHAEPPRHVHQTEDFDAPVRQSHGFGNTFVVPHAKQRAILGSCLTERATPEQMALVFVPAVAFPLPQQGDILAAVLTHNPGGVSDLPEDATANGLHQPFQQQDRTRQQE
ncbi:MAG: hypothetical protein ACRD1R_15300 [Acidobacteriota bacterium]